MLFASNFFLKKKTCVPVLEVCHIYSLGEGKNTAFGKLQNMLRELMFSKHAMNPEFSEFKSIFI